MAENTMPYDDEYQAARAIDTRIYRQIIVILAQRDPKEFREFHEKLIGLLKDVKYRRLGEPIEELGLVAIEVDQSEDISRLLGYLNGAKDVVRSAEQNRPIRLTQAAAPAVNDPRYGEQWGLRKISAEPAWQRAKDANAPSVVVAIVDSGISATHPDLAGHLWDDGAGHHGLNVLKVPDILNLPSTQDIWDVWDSRGHGTLLAGTIGAISNNALGVAGAEWPIKLMAVKFIDESTSPDAWNGIKAIWWAFLNGARVINLAWDLGLPADLPLGFLISTIQFLNAPNPPTLGPPVVFVAGAGNDGLDNEQLPTLPASFKPPNLISVMASDEDDDRPGFSNYGATTVHLAAPGVRILSTDSYFLTPQWREYSGTSAACAHVTSAAALLIALNPAAAPKQIRDHLVASVDKSRWLTRLCPSPPGPPGGLCVSQGRLNLQRAICGPLQITAPVAGAVWLKGSINTVTWNKTYLTPLCTSVSVLLLTPGLVTTVASLQPLNGACPVTAPNLTTNARIRIQSEQAPGLYAELDVKVS
jgi:subtilisin family serine protease